MLLSRSLLRWTWFLVIGLPIPCLLGELVFVIELREARRIATGYKLRHANIFDAQGAREAAHRSLWKGKRWSEYRPGARLEMVVAGERYLVEINSQGFRTHEFLDKKPPGMVRVICIGGSTTVQGRTNDETYPAVLERKLKEQHPSCSLEVLNFGISASASSRWLENPKGLFRYEPDVVVQYDGINDILWLALPEYAASHPWRKKLDRSLLLSRVFPVDLNAIDASLKRIINDEIALKDLCRQHHAEHIAGSFAAPDYGAAPPDQQAYLDVNVTDEWTAFQQSLRLPNYKAYARILARYNALFEETTGEKRLEGVMVHRALANPALFVDICHMSQSGIDRLAEAFYGPVAAAVESRCTSTGPASGRAASRTR